MTEVCEKYKIAIHEAGHAVMFFLCRQGVKSITIVPNEEESYAGCCSPVITNLGQRIEDGEATLKEFQDFFRISIAGRIAEELALINIDVIPGTLYMDNVEFLINGVNRAYNFESMVLDSSFPPGDENIKYEWLDCVVEESKAMMAPHINAIKAIADKLMQRKTISGRLARKIFTQSKKAKLAAERAAILEEVKGAVGKLSTEETEVTT